MDWEKFELHKGPLRFRESVLDTFQASFTPQISH